MAAVDRVFTFEDVDVFTIPHHRMKQILHNVSNQVIQMLSHDYFRKGTKVCSTKFAR